MSVTEISGSPQGWEAEEDLSTAPYMASTNTTGVGIGLDSSENPDPLLGFF